MVADILFKISTVVLILSLLNVARHLFFFIGSFIKSADEEKTQKFILSPRQLFLLGLSIAYILTTLFTGVKII